MADLQAIPRTAVAFTGYAMKSNHPDGLVAKLDGGTLRAFDRSATLELPAGQSHFGFMADGLGWLANEGMYIPKGFYFSIPGGTFLHFIQPSKGVIISRPDYQSYLTMGKIETEGRLRYIDGCTDSLLVPPVKLGDPCLNLLYFPPGINQTMHTHPSDRIGMILSGEGICDVEDAEGERSIPLTAGMLFCIHTGGHHRFRTNDQPMRVLAYHPDSDFGPTDQDHPMINRTMVNGVSARELTGIHTRDGG